MFQPKPGLQLEVRGQPVGEHQEGHEQEHRRGPPAGPADPAAGGRCRRNRSVAARSSTAYTCHGSHPTRRACRGVSSVEHDRHAGEHRQRHEREVHQPSGLARRAGAAGRATEPDPLGHPHTEGRREEEHEEGGQHRREVEELVRPVERQHGVEGEPDDHPEVPRAPEHQQPRDRQLDHGGRHDHGPLEPGRAVELERRQPDGVGGLVGSRRWRSSPTGRRTPS